MKALLVVISMLFATQAMAGGYYKGLPNKGVKKSVYEDSQKNPSRYQWDDGGNIHFGNGFYTRRFNFKGVAKVCHANNMLYAGVRNKCIKPIYEDDKVVGCKQSKKVELKTQMVGTAQVCTNNGDDDHGPCTKYTTVKFSKGPTVKVALYRKSQMDKDNKEAGFKGYITKTIPACN